MVKSFLKITTALFLIFNLSVLIISCAKLDSEVATIIISPSTATVGVEQSQSFSAIAKNAVGNIVTATVTWSVTGTIGSVSSNGLFTASSETATGYVNASYNTISASAAVTVTDKGWLTGRVQDTASGYVEGVKVYLDNYKSTLFDFSASDGRYSISDIPAGTYYAVIDSDNTYQSSSREVTITEGQSTTWNFVLQYQPGLNPLPTVTLPDFDF